MQGEMMGACTHSRGRTQSALTLTLALTLVTAGCRDSRVDQLQRDVARLEAEIKALKKSRADHRRRLDTLASRVTVLEDQRESEEYIGGAGVPVGSLPVVKVEPTSPEGTFSMIGEPHTPPPGRPGRAKRPSAPARGSGFSVKDANLRGLDPGPNLSVVPMPPPPHVAGGSSSATPHVPRPRPSSPPPEEPRPRASGPLPPPEGSAKAEYGRAFDAFRKGRHDLASRLFERFLDLYPRSDLADNAVYWMGEIAYKRGDYDRALGLFSKVVEEYPAGNKVSDAFLKIGLCYLNMGKKDAARQILGEVRRIFPESSAARIAEAQLKSL